MRNGTRKISFAESSMSCTSVGFWAVFWFLFGHKTAKSLTSTSARSGDRRTAQIVLIRTLWKAGIGTTSLNQSQEILTVNGKILCEEVQVISDVTPDYVFETYYNGYSHLKPDYVMPTLEEVEAFTKTNNHLPDVPSAKEIQENGLQLKEMTNIFCKKLKN